MKPTPSVPLLSPGSLRGFNSSMDPSAISAEFAALIENGRIGDGTCRSRNADAAIGNMPVSAYIVGSFECTLNGVLTWFLALVPTATGIPGVASVYMSESMGASWTNITPSSGPYGDLRFTIATTDVFVYFTCVKDSSYYGQTSYDIIVMQNGVDAPRIYGKATTWTIAGTPGTAITSKVTQSDLPVGPYLNYFSPENPLLINGGAATTSDSSAGRANHLIATNPGSALDYTWVAVIGTSTATGEFAQWYLAAGQDWHYLSQVTFVFKTTDASVLNNISFEITNNGAAYDKVFPNAVDYILVTPTNAPTGEIWYQLTVPITASTTAAPYTSVKGVRLKWTGATAPTTAITLTLIAVMGGGNTNTNPGYGGSFFGLATYSSDSRAVGPGVILARTPSPMNFLGASYNYSAMSLTEDDRLMGHYYIQWVNQSAAQLAAGIDYMNVYRNDPGQSGYYWVGAEQISTEAANVWSNRRSTPFWYSDDLSSSVSDRAIQIEDFTKPIPDAQTVCVPTGTAMTSVNGRLHVAGGSTRWFSRDSMPWMFRAAVVTLSNGSQDDASAGSRAMSGETVMQFVPLGFIDVGQESIGAPPNAAASLHFLSNRGFYRVSGWDALSLTKDVPVSQYGTTAPFSAARSKLGVYWQDQTGQVRLYDGNQTKAIGLKRVDNYTTGDANATNNVGVVVRDKYFLLISPNNRVLVYSELLGEWESYDTFDSGQVQAMFPTILNGGQELVCFKSSATTNGVIVHDNQGTPGTGVAFAITFRRLHFGYTQQLSIQDIRVACDGYTSHSLTTTILMQASSTTTDLTGTITLSTTGTLTDAANDLGTGVAWYAVQVKIASTTTVPGSWKMYAASTLVEATDIFPTRS